MGRPLTDKVPSKISISFSPINLRDMNKCIQETEFKTVADLVNTAVRYYFENRDKNAVTKEWLVSEEGSEYIKNIIRKVNEE